jgi:apolipoprotein N-acyltransferase
MHESSRKTFDGIAILMLVYTAASLLHFVHNATYLREYPNMPDGLTAFGVYSVWFGIVAVGAVGYWIYRRVHRFAGLILIAVYAVLGFAGLDHYVVAPVAAHSTTMHLTIAIEVACAAWLLIVVILRVAKPERRVVL